MHALRQGCLSLSRLNRPTANRGIEKDSPQTNAMPKPKNSTRKPTTPLEPTVALPLLVFATGFGVYYCCCRWGQLQHALL